MSEATFDVIIVGAGLAGATAAAVLAKAGRRVALVDPRDHCMHCFKAEKIEQDQAELLRGFGLLEAILPSSAVIREVSDARNGKILGVVPVEQYGILYHDMVNCIRRNLPSTVEVHVARVAEIVPGAESSEVTLVGGERMSARLVVLAAGTGSHLHEGLGIEKIVIRREHSLACGFNVELPSARPVPFNSLTYYPDGYATKIDYLTLFPIQGALRANLFCYRTAHDPWVRRFAKETGAVLRESMPQLSRLTGELRVVGKVEMAPIDLYRVAVTPKPGLVLIGDAFQSVCPSTGTGLSKVLTDVDILCSTCIPAWLATPGVGEDKIEHFYAEARKRDCDRSSLSRAAYRRQLSTDSSLRWQLHREKLYLKMMASGWSDRVRHRVEEWRGAAQMGDAEE
jgi:2-polyprenyl-6-methoxyphenol hydroxylase-like FAD-dependent oxidoreductase